MVSASESTARQRRDTHPRCVKVQNNDAPIALPPVRDVNRGVLIRVPLAISPLWSEFIRRFEWTHPVGEEVKTRWASREADPDAEFYVIGGPILCQRE